MRQVLIYDINVCPVQYGIAIEEIINLYEERNVVLWDSTLAVPGVDCVPKVIHPEEGVDIKILDVQDDEELRAALAKTLDLDLARELLNFRFKDAESKE